MAVNLPSDEWRWSVNYMKTEQKRLRSFGDQWPKSEIVQPKTLAKAGFFYMNDADYVMCPYCDLVVNKWKAGDKPLREHIKQSPKCPFVTGSIDESEQQQQQQRSRSTADNPLNSSVEPKKKTPVPLRPLPPPPLPPPPPPPPPPIRNNQQQFSGWNDQMQNEQLRLQSFGDRWRQSDIVEPKALAKAGFFYIYKDDWVKCPYCDVTVGNWKAGDKPLREHIKQNPKCPFVMGSIDESGQQQQQQRSSSTTADNTVNSSVEPKQKTPVPLLQQPSSQPPLSSPPSPPPIRIDPQFSGGSVWMKNEQRRLQSFVNLWHKSDRVEPKALAKAGFFFLNFGDDNDFVRCPYCKVTLCNWEAGDEPLREHIKHSPKCPFVMGSIDESGQQQQQQQQQQQRSSSTTADNTLNSSIEPDKRAPMIPLSGPQNVLWYPQQQQESNVDHLISSTRLKFQQAGGGGGDTLNNNDIVTSTILESKKNSIYPDMMYTENRLETFVDDGYFSEIYHPDKRIIKKLATCGFFCPIVSDMVVCFWCGKTVRVKSKQDLENMQHDKDCYYSENRIFFKYIQYEDLFRIDARLQTFSIEWNHCLEPTPVDLATKGFFYPSKTSIDVVVCFMCGGTLEKNYRHRRREYQNPMIEHLKHNPDCQYSNYFLEHDSLSAITDSTTTMESDDSNSTENRLLCKICLDEDIGITFEPCGHCMTCVKCSKSIDKCPICRSLICFKINTYIC